MMDYKPATAIVTTYQNTDHAARDKRKRDADQPGRHPGPSRKVASLIGVRAARRIEREMRLANAN